MTEKGKRSSRWQKLMVPYRLTIMNHDTFEEIGSYRLTLLNLYIALCVALFLGAAFVLLLIFFTPLKKWIPGYQNISQNTEFVVMERKLNNMEKELIQYKQYTDKLSNIIHGTPSGDSIESLSNISAINEILTPQPDTTIPEEDALRQKMETQEITTINTIVPNSTNIPDRSLSQLYFVPPVSGEISAGYLAADKHFGVDILAPKNTPVKAILDGYVISSDWTLETGNTLGIQHNHNLISFYKHNSQLLKSIGDQVRAGEAIAIIGNTGTLSDGPHLHFELWSDGKPVNPEDYIVF